MVDNPKTHEEFIIFEYNTTTEDWTELEKSFDSAREANSYINNNYQSGKFKIAKKKILVFQMRKL